MSRRRDIAAVMTGCWLALGGVTSASVTAAAVASGPSAATAPQQLVNQYPLGPQRLCCNGQSGVTGQTRSTPASGSHRPAGVAPGRAHVASKPTDGGSSGGVPTVLLIGVGVLAGLFVAGATAVYRTRRGPLPAPARATPAPPAGAYANRTAPGAGLAAANAGLRAGPTWDRSPVPAAAASEAEEREFRRLDEDGDAGGAFNLGVVLHQRGDLAGATAAYERAEQRGDPDAGFNLGVLLYEGADLDGAEDAWRRSARGGHARAAANLVFLSRRRRELERGTATLSKTPGLAEFEELSYRRADESGAATGAFNLGVTLHQRGDVAGAAAAYERAAERGDPDATFNLGVLLYEAGDLDRAETAWRRSAARGHARATGNLEFLLRHRRELEAAGVTGKERDDR
jgi:TPR repeat protein